MATFGLMDFKRTLKSNSGAIVSAALGVAGIGAVKFALNSIKLGGVPLASKIPAQLAKFTPLLASVVVFGGTLMATGGKNKKATSFAVGALTAGVTLTAYDLLKDTFPAMNDLYTYNLPGMGFIVPNSDRSKFNGLTNLGLLAPDAGSARLNMLAQSARPAMNEYVEYDIP